MFSIHVDWQEAFINGKWDFVGRDSLSFKTQDEDPDAGIPMMNYAYPLETTPDDATIKKITRDTSCTVVYNNEEDQYYLALTGGGMNLSQDIALAYMIAQGFIEWDLLSSVCLTNPLSVGKENFKKILKEAIRQFEIVEANAKRDLEQARETLTRYK